MYWAGRSIDTTQNSKTQAARSYPRVQSGQRFSFLVSANYYPNQSKKSSSSCFRTPTLPFLSAPSSIVFAPVPSFFESQNKRICANWGPRLRVDLETKAIGSGDWEKGEMRTCRWVANTLDDSTCEVCVKLFSLLSCQPRFFRGEPFLPRLHSRPRILRR